MEFHINNLPDSLIIKIFSYLEQVELHLAVSWVCKKWNTLCYDRDLWRHFMQFEYEICLAPLLVRQPLINTMGFQRYIIKKVHPHIQHLSLYHWGMNLLSFLDRIALPQLQEINISNVNAKKFNERNLSNDAISSIKRIHKSTSAKVLMSYSSVGIQYDYIPLCCEESIGFVSTGVEDCQHSLVKDWADVLKRLCEHPDISSVLLDQTGLPFCENDTLIPKKIFKQLSQMENLQKLYLRELDLCDLDELSEAEINQLSKNLLVLDLQAETNRYYFSDGCGLSSIREVLSNAHSLRRLWLQSFDMQCLSVISKSCRELTELTIHFIRKPVNPSCFCDTAYHCTKLRKIRLCRVYIKNLNQFLQILGQRCKNMRELLLSVNVPQNEFEDIENGLADVYRGCTRLKCISISIQSKNEACCNFPKLENFKSKSQCERLIMGENLEIPLEALDKLCNLTMLSFVSRDAISTLFIETLNKNCSRLTFLSIREKSQTKFKDQKASDRGAAVIDNISLMQLKYLYLNLKQYIPNESIRKLLQRLGYLEELELRPVQEDAQEIVTYELGNRSHFKLFSSEKNNLLLIMVSDTRWKQLTAPQWKDSWRSKLVPVRVV